MTNLQIIARLESMLHDALDIIRQQEEVLLMHGIEIETSDLEQKRQKFYDDVERAI